MADWITYRFQHIISQIILSILEKQYITFHLYPILIAYSDSVDNTEQYTENIMFLSPFVLYVTIIIQFLCVAGTEGSL
jgi:hypothetical protein